MTYPEFLAALRRTPRDWYLGPAGELRRGAGKLTPGQRECPLMAVCPNERWGCGFQRTVRVAADNFLELGRDPANGLVPAAVRVELLAACGLMEA